jgi:hypothetical protein
MYIDVSAKVLHGDEMKVILHYTLFHHHHHKNQGLDPLIHSVSRVTAARTNASSVFYLFSFLVVCSGMISKGHFFNVYIETGVIDYIIFSQNTL